MDRQCNHSCFNTNTNINKAMPTVMILRESVRAGSVRVQFGRIQFDNVFAFIHST